MSSEETQPSNQRADDRYPSDGPPNRFLWFFRLSDGGNQCTEYVTDDREEAMDWLEVEYGEVPTDAVRRELTFHEYVGLLRCNYEGPGEKVYEAIQDFFFRCDPREDKAG